MHRPEAEATALHRCSRFADSDRSIDCGPVVPEQVDKTHGLKWPADLVDDINTPPVYIDAPWRR